MKRNFIESLKNKYRFNKNLLLERIESFHFPKVSFWDIILGILLSFCLKIFSHTFPSSLKKLISLKFFIFCLKKFFVSVEGFFPTDYTSLCKYRHWGRGEVLIIYLLLLLCLFVIIKEEYKSEIEPLCVILCKSHKQFVQ